MGETFWSFSENLSWASYFAVSAGHLILSPYHGPVCQFHNLRRGKSQLGCEIPEARNRKGLKRSGKKLNKNTLVRKHIWLPFLTFD